MIYSRSLSPMMFRVRARSSFLRWISSVLIIATVILVILQLIVYSRNRAHFPAGLVIADVPVGGISRQEAAERLLEVYGLPVELRYGDSIIHLDPAQVDFNLNLEGMIAAADLQRTGSSFWGGFWNYLWGGTSSPQAVPLDATYSEDQLRVYLHDEIAARYDKPPTAAQPIAGTTQFSPGLPGTVLDVDKAVQDIEVALFSSSQRGVTLSLEGSTGARPSLANLQVQLQQIIDVSGFDGLADIYFQDLANGQELHFVYQLGSNLPSEPDVSFTAASTIKIPILISIFSRLDEQPNDATRELLNEMIIQSFNEPADLLMEGIIDPDRAPLAITDDLRKLGIENTFLAGQFFSGAPLLANIQTPSRERADVFTDPDVYNIATPSDLGVLLSDLYQCADSGGGALIAVFQSDITQAECQDMINLLSQNKIGVLLEAGVPDGTRVAHKHGWVTNFTTGVINTMGDAGIIYTPTGNYALVIFLYQPVQLIYDPAAELFAQLGEAIYNYYTLPDKDFSQTQSN
jgi:beta-lactamase class A